MRRKITTSGGKTRCKTCNHPGLQAIDAMLLNGAKYKDIIAKMLAAHPGEVELNEANLSRHWSDHVQAMPIKVDTTDPETGLVTQGYLAGHLMQTLDVDREKLPKNAVPIADALKTIISAGVRNILLDPTLVGPKELVAALEMARKLGLFGNDAEEFAEAWKEFAAAKQSGRKKRTTRTVTVQQTEELDEDAPQIIDVQPVTPEEWSEADIKLLEGPNDEKA